MNIKTLLPVLLFLLNIIPVQLSQGQQNDCQFWPSFKLNVEVIKNLKFHIEEEIRFQENVSQFGRQINDIGMSYRLNKHIKTALFYRIEAKWKNADEYAWRKGLYGDLAFRYELSRLSLGYRVRVQTYRTEINDKQAVMFSGFRHRHKIFAEYDIKGLPFSPFAEGELFIDYKDGRGSELSSFRTWIGLSYSLGKTHDISLKYGIDQELNAVDPIRAYIIALGYSLDLKLKSVK